MSSKIFENFLLFRISSHAAVAATMWGLQSWKSKKGYGKSWRVGNASRNETNEILTVYLWKVWVFIPRRRIRVIWHSDQHLFWQSYWVKDIDREYLEGNAQTSNIWYFPRKETTRLQVSQHSWQKGMNQRGTSLILDYCQ